MPKAVPLGIRAAQMDTEHRPCCMKLWKLHGYSSHTDAVLERYLNDRPCPHRCQKCGGEWTVDEPCGQHPIYGDP